MKKFNLRPLSAGRLKKDFEKLKPVLKALERADSVRKELLGQVVCPPNKNLPV